MANEIRRYSNFKSGTITNNPLAVGGLSLTSAALAGLPVVDATDYMALVLDPLGAANGPELVYLTAHTVASTTGTIVRGREGTSAVQHAVNTPWITADIASDLLTVGTTAQRPTVGLYRGRPYLDTDTNELLRDATGAQVWVPEVLLGAWRTFTPTWTTTGSAPSLGNGTLTGRYFKHGRSIRFIIGLTFGSTTNGGLGNYKFALPAAAAAGFEQWVDAKAFTNPFNWMGRAVIDTGASVAVPYFPIDAGNNVHGPFNQANPGTPNVGAAFPMKTGANMYLSGEYEAAA